MRNVRQRAMAHAQAKAAKKTATPVEQFEDADDAAELEYQEKTTRQRRTKKQKLEVDEPSKPKRKYTRRKKKDEDK